MVLRCLPFLVHLLVWPLLLLDVQASSFSSVESFEPTADIPVSNGEELLPSWETLKETLETHPGVPSHSFITTRLRLFGEDKKERLIMLRRDACWCAYSLKVVFTLEEKQISYALRVIDGAANYSRPDSYYETNALNHCHLGLVLFATEHENTIVTDSPNILQYIEDNFPNHKSLWPAEGTPERRWIDSALQLEDELLAADSLNSNWDRLSEFDNALDKYEEALQKYDGPWFLGHEFSGADIHFSAIFEMVVACPPYHAGYPLRFSGKWPRLDAWFDELLTRKSYQLVKTDDYTMAHDSFVFPELIFTVHERSRRRDNLVQLPKGASWRAIIDGTNGSWDLPLGPIKLVLGSDDGTGANGKKEEAAKILVFNHDAVTLFALRAVTGADAGKYLEKVDLALQFTAYALLVGVENVPRLPNEILITEVAEAVEYVRDRVAVPRDMSPPAARQFRAYLHWMAKTIKES